MFMPYSAATKFSGMKVEPSSVSTVITSLIRSFMLDGWISRSLAPNAR